MQTDRTVLFFALALSLAAPVIFGIVPALSSSRSEQVSERSGSSSRETRWLRNLLVTAEVALSIVLVVGAVLLLRSLGRLQDVNPGFAREHAITFTMTLPTARYPDAAARFRAFTEIERRLREQPGVQAVGATSTLPLRGFTWSGDTTIEGRAATDYERDTKHMSMTPSYFGAMGVPSPRGAPVRRRRYARQAARHHRQRVPGEALLPRAPQRRCRRQAHLVRPSPGQFRMDHDRRRRRRREAGGPGSAGRADRLLQHRTGAAESADVRRPHDRRL